MSKTKTPQLTCKNLTIGYDGKTVVSDLSFEVHAGDYLCIVGENGTGKSTLMKTLLRLKSPMSGEIISGDGLSANEIGYLPQQTVVQKDFPATVREVVLSGCLNKCGLRPFYNRQEKQLAIENMAKLGMSPQDISEALGFSPATYYNYMREPGKVQVGTLRRLRRRLALTEEQVLDILQ